MTFRGVVARCRIIRNYYDECPEFPGWKDNGCPRMSSLEQTVTLRDAKTITVGTIAKANAVSQRSVAKLVVIGPGGERVEVYGEENTKTSSSAESVKEVQLGAQDVLPGGEGDAPGDFEAVEQDISQFAGEQVTIKIVTVGRATFEINALKIRYDTDGDGLYDAVERGSCGLRDGTGQCLDTDPYLADTDGDGLSDSYEIKERRKVHGHVYQELRSNPTVRDTDRDGLDDEQEVRGSFRFAVTRSAEASLGYLNGQTPEDKSEHLTQETTDSDPLAVDSDNDGLNDREEWLYKTDPRNPDSDGDDLLDGKERPIGADPTLHDYRGPDIRLVKHGARFRENGTEIQFVLVYYAVDHSTVTKTTVRKNGDVRYASRPSTFISRHNGSFTDEYFGEGISGTKVEITATDRHGNRKTAAGIRRSNDCGQKAKRWTGTDTLDSSMFARGYAACSGFQASIGSTIQEILAFANNPFGFLDGLIELIRLLDETGLLDMFIDALVSSLQDKQETNNPYSKGSPHYDEYKRAWYGGYAAGFIAKAIYGASATKVLKGSDYLQGISKYAKSTRAGQAAMRVKAPYDRGKARVATGLARGSTKAAGPLIRRAKSAGATYRLWQLQRKGDIDTNDLSDAERRRVSVFLAQHGEDGAARLRWMDDEAFQRMFRKACDGGSPGALETGGGGCTKLSKAEQRQYGRAVGEADVGLGRFYRNIDEAGVSETAAERFVAQNGPAALRLSVRMDAKAFGRLVEMDADAQEAVVKAWRSDSMAVSTADVEAVVTRVDSLETGKRTKAIRLLEDADAAGIKFIDQVDHDSLKRLLELDTEPTRAARANLARKVADGQISSGQVVQFADDATEIKNEDGFESILKDVARAGPQGNVDGPIYEARVAAEIGSDRVHAMGRKVGEAGETGEIDIELENGDVVEVKSQKWNQMGRSQYQDLEKKMTAINKYKNMDGGSVIYVVKELSVSSSRIKEFANHWEEKIKADYGVDVEIRFIEDADKV